MNYAKKNIKFIVDWIRTYFENNGPTSKAIVGISGGKDSSIVAALCVLALGPSRVIGVKMPQGNQHDINCANQLIDFLSIDSYEINIGESCDALYAHLAVAGVELTPQVTSNLPARIRMATLYAVAASEGGRVANTCNRSEDYVGYATKYGDGAGDFSPLSEYTVREVIEIGDALGLPHNLVHKVPEDGLCGKTDEENLGFTYDILDDYLLEGIIPDEQIYNKIQEMHNRNIHKLQYMPVCPHRLAGYAE